MKTIRVKIRKNRTPAMTTLEWPAWWGEVYDKVDILAYEDGPELGRVEEYAVGVADDETVEKMLKLDGGKGDVEVVHPDYADEMVRLWKPGRALQDLAPVAEIAPVGLTKERDRGRPLKAAPVSEVSREEHLEAL